ncbi:WecB/TagA/CpsF family glycosyltransferase [Flavobacteriaceae bacterium MHTCC 0001]
MNLLMYPWVDAFLALSLIFLTRYLIKLGVRSFRDHSSNTSLNSNLKHIIKHHVFSKELKDINLSKRCIINTINPHSYCVSKKDAQFKEALLQSDYLMPDGVGIVLASKVLYGKSIKKIAGADVHDYLLKYAYNNNKKVFYLGASNNTLKLIEDKLKHTLPNMSIGSYSPPYKPEFSVKDSIKMIAAVNAFKPDILFIGMTAPKQEKWLNTYKAQLHFTVATSIGAVFDFYAGTVKRSSPFWIKLGLEWLPRLLKEPKRLWKRNLVSTPLFLLNLSIAKLNLE